MSGKSIVRTRISDRIWQFDEPREAEGALVPYVDAYLVEGDKGALLVDCLQSCTGLYRMVRELCDLPLTVVITHGHGDHAGASLREFREVGCPIYMDTADLPELKRFGSEAEESWFVEAEEGAVFDLGGLRFELVSVPGHSRGSIVLLDRENQLLFSGDAIGSGHFWMQIPSALPLNLFLASAEKLYAKTRGLERLLVYPGHRSQSPVQLTGRYVKDCVTITKRILDGVLVGEDAELEMHGMRMKYKSVSYGSYVSYCYDPENLRFGRPDPAVEAIKERFDRGEITEGSLRMPYRLFSPAVEKGSSYPLVVYLHGAGERGDDNVASLANPGATTFASEKWQGEHPCFVLAPQCAEGLLWTDERYVRLIVKALMTLPTRLPIDRQRIYLTGLSLGGMGTWNLIAKEPGLFAAAMPICGAGDPTAIRRAHNVPVWAFHAVDDPVVPVSGRLDAPALQGASLYGTRTMVASLRGAMNPKVRYTEYASGEMAKLGRHPHCSWFPAYEDRQALEWLFEQSLRDRYEVEFLAPGFWHIEDAGGNSLYLVEGADKALAIDTGMGGGDLIGLLRSLTRLPLELAITHAHIDHLFHAKAFGVRYLSSKDAAILSKYPHTNSPIAPLEARDTRPISDGESIDLGGGVVVEAIEVGGHTPGSLAFLDRSRGVCFTGDAIGSGCGVWMQVPEALSLTEYKANLERFYARLSEKGLEDLRLFGGHKNQELGFPPGSDFNPLTRETVRDMSLLCDKIMSDDTDFKPFALKSFDEPALVASYASASLVFTMSRIR